MVDPVLTYVAGIGFLVLLIGPMLYLMYNYEGIDAAEDTPNENVVQGAGPIAAEGPDADEKAVEGGADDTRDAVEAGEPEDAEEADADDTEKVEADEA
jgi:hypothetical protein